VSQVPAPDGTCADTPYWRDGECYFRVLGPDHPPSVYRWRPDQPHAVPVTPVAVLARRTPPAVHRLVTGLGFDLPAIVYEPVAEDRGTVVMLHGGPAACWRNGWNPVLLAMTGAGYRVVLLETRGTTFNAWPVPPLPVTAHGVAEVVDVGACLSALYRLGLAAPHRTVLAGHSHGAFVAYRASLAHAGVAGVIMTSGYLHPRALTASADPEVLRFAEAAFADHSWAGDVAQGLESRCPVLVVHGERDNQVPVADAQAMFARLSGTGHEWLLLDGDDHSFRIRRNAERYARAAVAFLDRVQGRVSR
jgi:dipeptidyl aminopeptidase/acylaminoacyl peptidase